MSRIVTAALEHVVIERDMPKGYTWAKIHRCWTVHPKGARFFAPRVSDFGDEVPAAYFTAVIAYDPAAGYHEREVKFVGDEAEALNFALSENGYVALICAEGHVSTSAVKLPDGRTVARSTILLKCGMTRLVELRRADDSPVIDASTVAERIMLEQAANMAIREARCDESVWPSATGPEPESMDDAPF